ncbi:MAG: cation ABC transporter substrate-binding protein [Neisseriaceae bacterium]|nr:MAG: cation ABC transporter substrate-binding protein [Neisseriaceae bacterium]
MKNKLLLICGLLCAVNVFAAPINIVAAENFYGELAKEIGGKNVAVTSIISNPDADPHLFTTSPSTLKAVSAAQIIIYNGADYDDWMKQILANVDKKKTIIINVADLMNVKSGANPHLWYKPETFPMVAKSIASNLNKLDPQDKDVTQQNLAKFLTDNNKVTQLITVNKQKYQGTPVTATEPVFGYMSDALGLKMYGQDFQWKIMNDSEPTPKMIADYEGLLTNKKVKLLFYNNQVSDSMTKNMQNLAKENGIAVVGVTETMPQDISVNQWLTNEINATSQALAKVTSKK